MPTVPRAPSRTISFPRARIPRGPHPAEIAGAALGETGRLLAPVAESFAQARQTTELSNARSAFMEEVLDFKTDLQDKHDYQNFETYLDKFLEDSRNRYHEQLRDPEVWRHFSREFQKTQLDLRTDVRALARKKLIDFGRGSYFANQTRWKNRLYGADEKDRETLISLHRVITAGNVDAGFLSVVEGEKAEQDFRRDADTAAAMQDLRDDPENFDAGNYPNIEARNKILLNDQAVNRMEAAERKRIRDAEKAEKAAEKKLKKQLEENEFGLWQEFVAARDNPAELAEFSKKLEDMATRRKIDKDGYKALIKAMETDEEDEVNDPGVVGEIAEMLELGMDIRPKLDEAIKGGKIKTQTYINMRKAAVTARFKRGFYYLQNSMKPTEMEKWSPDRHLRYAEAMDELSARVAEGEDPVEASYEIVEGYLGERRRTLSGLRKPRFLVGEKDDAHALAEAKRITTEKYINKVISPQEYNREMELIEELKDLIREQMRLEREARRPGEKSERLEKEMKRRE